MASIPPRQASQRRASPEQQSGDRLHHSAQPSPVRTRSVHSEDSQTVFLNSPAEPESEQQQPPPALQTGTAAQDDDGSKKCWICFADSTEDTPETSPWRDPCPCALVAHEECLLDWIADLEAPNRNRSRGIAAPKIECPQCKGEIKLARPRDYVVELERAIERAGTRAVTPGAAMTLSGLMYVGGMVFGVHSIYAVFGSEDGYRILWPLLREYVRPPIEVPLMVDAEMAKAAADKALEVLKNKVEHWRLYTGIPLIAPIIILSRTTLADSILPFLPAAYFATIIPSAGDAFEFGTWPPSASLAFAILPYVRQMYNYGYKRLFAEREKRWLKELQPRATQTNNDGGANEAQGQQDGGGEQGDEFEIRVDAGIWEDWEEEEEEEEEDEPAPHNAPPPQPAMQNQVEQQGPADPPPNIADNRVDNGPQEPQPPARQPAQPHQHQHPIAQADRRLAFSPTAVAQSLLGAILYPSVASLSGELLKLVLPLAWTTPKHNSCGVRVGVRGLLQEKWGRSLVGGCLFVVLKDAVMLYARWRMTQLHRQRRVLDYAEGRRGRA